MQQVHTALAKVAYYLTDTVSEASLRLQTHLPCLKNVGQMDATPELGHYCDAEFSSTVEPLSNDHPHQRPSLLYDRILCDGHVFCLYDP